MYFQHYMKEPGLHNLEQGTVLRGSPASLVLMWGMRRRLLLEQLLELPEMLLLVRSKHPA